MTTHPLHAGDAPAWHPVDPAQAPVLADARAQLHHCAQFVSCFGISYLSHASDDSHTSMGWDAERGALVSHSFGSVSVALRLADMVLLILVDGRDDVELTPHGVSIATLEGRLRAGLTDAGLDAARYTLERHFEIPSHPVASGGAFDASDRTAFTALSAWYADASLLLEEIRDARHGSTVRCWPHHFDIATLVTVSAGRTTGAGLAPGDSYYDEPYFYVNAYPQPDAAALRASALRVAPRGGGHWHTHQWIGAVLPGSRLADAIDAQATQSRDFFRSSLDALEAILTEKDNPTE